MQKAYIDAVYELALKDKNVVMLTADNGTDFDKWFQREFPDQYFDMGISEGNMAAAAAGMSTLGKIPFVQTAGAFLAYRAFEFIRNDVCLQRSNVKLVGSGSGLSISNLGPTHHTTEDLSVLRSLPGVTILSPCSPLEVIGCINEAYKRRGPVYIRLGMSGEKEIYSSDYEFQLGKCVEVRKGKDAVLFVTGSILSEAAEASDILREESGIGLKVVNVHTLKPVFRGEIIEQIESKSVVLTLEEHNICGGLGSLLAECLCEERWGGKLIRLGLRDCFAKGYGSVGEVRKRNELDKEHIAEVVREALDRRA